MFKTPLKDCGLFTRRSTFERNVANKTDEISTCDTARAGVLWQQIYGNPTGLPGIYTLEQLLEIMRKSNVTAMVPAQNILLLIINKFAKKIIQSTKAGSRGGIVSAFRPCSADEPPSTKRMLSELFGQADFVIRFLTNCPEYIKRLTAADLQHLVDRHPHNLKIALLAKEYHNSVNLGDVVEKYLTFRFPDITENKLREHAEELIATIARSDSAAITAIANRDVLGALSNFVAEKKPEFQDYFVELQSNKQAIKFFSKCATVLTGPVLLNFVTVLGPVLRNPDFEKAFSKVLTRNSRHPLLRLYSTAIAESVDRSNYATVNQKLLANLENPAIRNYLKLSETRNPLATQWHATSGRNIEVCKLIASDASMVSKLVTLPPPHSTAKERINDAFIKAARSINDSMAGKWFDFTKRKALSNFLRANILENDHPDQALCYLVSKNENYMTLLKDMVPHQWSLFPSTRERARVNHRNLLINKSPFIRSYYDKQDIAFIARDNSNIGYMSDFFTAAATETNRNIICYELQIAAQGADYERLKRTYSAVRDFSLEPIAPPPPAAPVAAPVVSPALAVPPVPVVAGAPASTATDSASKSGPRHRSPDRLPERREVPEAAAPVVPAPLVVLPSPAAALAPKPPAVVSASESAAEREAGRTEPAPVAAVPPIGRPALKPEPAPVAAPEPAPVPAAPVAASEPTHDPLATSVSLPVEPASPVPPVVASPAPVETATPVPPTPRDEAQALKEALNSKKHRYDYQQLLELLNATGKPQEYLQSLLIPKLKSDATLAVIMLKAGKEQLNALDTNLYNIIVDSIKNKVTKKSAKRLFSDKTFFCEVFVTEGNQAEFNAALNSKRKKSSKTKEGLQTISEPSQLKHLIITGMIMPVFGPDLSTFYNANKKVVSDILIELAGDTMSLERNSALLSLFMSDMENVLAKLIGASPEGLVKLIEKNVEKFCQELETFAKTPEKELKRRHLAKLLELSSDEKIQKKITATVNTICSDKKSILVKFLDSEYCQACHREALKPSIIALVTSEDAAELEIKTLDALLLSDREVKAQWSNPKNKATHEAVYKKAVPTESSKRDLDPIVLKLILNRGGKLFFKELQVLLGLSKPEHDEIIFTNKNYCRTLARKGFNFSDKQKLLMLSQAVQEQDASGLFLNCSSLNNVLQEALQYCLQSPDDNHFRIVETAYCNETTRKKFFEGRLNNNLLAKLLKKASVDCLNILATSESKLISELKIELKIELNFEQNYECLKKDYFNCIETIFKERGMCKFDANNYQNVINGIFQNINVLYRCKLLSELLEKNDEYVTKGIIAMGNAPGIVECFRETDFVSKVFVFEKPLEETNRISKVLVARFILGELNNNESVVTREQLSEVLKKNVFFDEVFDQPSNAFYNILLAAIKLLPSENEATSYLDTTKPGARKVIVTKNEAKSGKKTTMAKAAAVVKTMLPRTDSSKSYAEIKIADTKKLEKSKYKVLVEQASRADGEGDHLHANTCYALLLAREEKAKRKKVYEYSGIKGNVGIAVRVLSGYKHCTDPNLLEKAFKILLSSEQKKSLFVANIDLDFFADPGRFNAFAKDGETKNYNKDVEHYFKAAIESKKISSSQALRSPLADMLDVRGIKDVVGLDAQAARCCFHYDYLYNKLSANDLFAMARIAFSKSNLDEAIAHLQNAPWLLHKTNLYNKLFPGQTLSGSKTTAAISSTADINKQLGAKPLPAVPATPARSKVPPPVPAREDSLRTPEPVTAVVAETPAPTAAAVAEKTIVVTTPAPAAAVVIVAPPTASTPSALPLEARAAAAPARPVAPPAVSTPGAPPPPPPPPPKVSVAIADAKPDAKPAPAPTAPARASRSIAKPSAVNLQEAQNKIQSQSKDASYGNLPKDLTDALINTDNTYDPTGVKSLLQKITDAKAEEAEINECYQKLEKLMTTKGKAEGLIARLKTVQAGLNAGKPKSDEKQKISSYDLFSTLTPALYTRFKATHGDPTEEDDTDTDTDNEDFSVDATRGKSTSRR